MRVGRFVHIVTRVLIYISWRRNILGPFDCNVLGKLNNVMSFSDRILTLYTTIAELTILCDEDKFDVISATIDRNFHFEAYGLAPATVVPQLFDESENTLDQRKEFFFQYWGKWRRRHERLRRSFQVT